MHTSACIAIFVKTPGYSPIKTRLAAQLDVARAEQFHLYAASAVASVCAQVTNLSTYFAIAEADAFAIHQVDPVTSPWGNLAAVFQGEGGLGQRMWQVYNELRTRHPIVFLIGADIPQLQADDIREMLIWLQQDSPRMAIAPSDDGGFWCFGGNCDIALNAWNSVDYSVASTRVAFSANLTPFGCQKLFKHLADVDEYADLLAANTQLHKLSNPTAAQKELMHLLSPWFTEI